MNICETIGINLWHAPRHYERLERKLFFAALKPRCTILDVGANIGIYSLLASKRKAHVIAIEADPINVKALWHNLKRNRLTDRVDVYEMAAKDRPKTLTLYRNPFNSGASSVYGQGEGIAVQGRTIDSLELPPIDLCKMDVEGGELPALRGMSETIRRSPNMKLLLKCSRDHVDLVRFLRAYSKHIWVVGRGKLKMIDLFYATYGSRTDLPMTRPMGTFRWRRVV